MDKSQIADILINEKNDEKDAIPIILDVDNEELVIDLRRTSGILLLGKNANESLDRIIGKLTSLDFMRIDDCDEMEELYELYLDTYRTGRVFHPGLVIVVKNIEAICKDSPQSQEHFIDILRKGHGINLYFICGISSSDIPQEISINFSVKIEDFHTDGGSSHNAIFDYIGKRQSIRFKKTNSF